MKPRKVEYYNNGMEMLSTDFNEAKTILLGMEKYRAKLSGYAPYTTKKASKNDLIVDRFIIDKFEFIVVRYEAMNFSLDSMQMSKQYLATSIYWQRIK